MNGERGAGSPSSPHFYVAAALLAAALFGAATPASKTLLASLPPQQLAALLYLGAALGVAPWALRSPRFWPRERSSRSRLALAVGFGGVLGPVLLLLGLERANSASVALWLQLELFATALLGALWFRDPLGRAGWLSCAGALAAGLLLSLAEGRAGPRAASLVAAACLCWALDNHWTARIDGVGPSVTTLWKGLAGGALNAALAFGAGDWRSDASSLLAALGVGALGYGASIALSVAAAQGLGATRAQLLFATAPGFGLAGAWFALGEAISRAQLAGVALLGASVALLFRERHAHPHRHSPLRHLHLHRHDDGHHLHEHPGQPASLRHSHWHEHAALAHAHPHLPDLHHRHGHGDPP